MRRKVNQIRDVDYIEKELVAFKSGLLAFTDNKEKVNQIAASFIYENKNIYILFEENDEMFDVLLPNGYACFSIYGASAILAEEMQDQLKHIQVKCLGILKKVEDQKIFDEISRKYAAKYDLTIDTSDDIQRHLLMIDTEEIQAVEISGGY